MKTMDKELKKYYLDISRHMMCKKKEKNRLLSDIKSNISNYTKENPECTYQEIVEHYGTPEDIWESHLETLNADDINSSVKKSKFIKIAIAVVVGVILLCILILFIDRQINRPTRVEEKIEEVLE